MIHIVRRVESAAASNGTTAGTPSRRWRSAVRWALNGRFEQQDSFAVAHLSIGHDASCVTIVVLADGMGGLARGAEASRVAVDCFMAAALQALGPYTSNDATFTAPEAEGILRASLSAAEGGVSELRETHGEAGTTLVALLLGSTWGVCINVGDSAAFLMRDGELQVLTEDHSAAGELVRQGVLTEQESRAHASRAVLARYLGADTEAHPHVATFKAIRGDRILVATDGVWAPLGLTAIERSLSAPKEINIVAEEILATSRTAGSTDNQTLTLLESPERVDFVPLPIASSGDER